MMTLHVFADTYGLYPYKSVENVEKYCNDTTCIFINLVDNVKIEHKRIQLGSTSIKQQKKIILSLPYELNCIVFHAYHTQSYYFLSFIKEHYPNAKVFWVFWSFELYNLPSKYLNLLGPFSTAFYAQKRNNFNTRLKNLAFSILPDSYINGMYKLFDKATVTEKKLIESHLSIDTFCSLHYHDYLYLKTEYDLAHIQYQKFAYLSLENIIPKLDDYKPCGNVIMVGHAARIDSNHYEILHTLRSFQLPNTIFIPLSYGDSAYAAAITAYANSSFSSVEILDTFLPSDAYYAKLMQVGYCIINTRVQQALGNIIALLWHGAKLFLSATSSTYLDFKEAGMIVFSIEDDLCKEALIIKLTFTEIMHNRQILFSTFSNEQISMYWSSLI